MALDASHPAIVEHNGSLGAVTIPKSDALEAIARRREWEAALARRTAVASRPLLIGGVLGALLAIVLGVFVWRIDGIEKYALVVPVGFFLGAVIGSVARRALAGPESDRPPFVPPAPIHGIAPEVIENAPSDSSVDDILRWTRDIWVFQQSVKTLPEARASVARKDYELPIPPGDRSTWYHDPESLARMEAELPAQRAAYERTAAELGFTPV